MSFILVDYEDDKHEVKINAWNWRPTLEIIRTFNLFDEEKLEMLGCNGVGASVTTEEAHEIGQRLRDNILPTLKPGERILHDLTITSEPREPHDFTRSYPPEESLKIYSARYEWLKTFSEFCLSSKGFKVG